MAAEYENRVVLITGAAGGIGKAVARRFLSAGAQVFAADLRADLLAAAAAELGATPGATIYPIEADVTVVRDCERMVAVTVAGAGRLDVLVNCAGLWVEGPSETMTEADWDRVVVGQPQGHVLLLPLRHPRAAQDAGLHRQHLLRRRCGGHARDGDLHGLQGRREPAHQVARARARPRPRARQRGLSGRRHDAHAALPGRHLRRAATPRATSSACWAATRRASAPGSSAPTRWPSWSATWPARRRRPSPAPSCRSTSERARATATPDRPADRPARTQGKKASVPDGRQTLHPPVHPQRRAGHQRGHAARAGARQRRGDLRRDPRPAALQGPARHSRADPRRARPAAPRQGPARPQHELRGQPQLLRRRLLAALRAGGRRRGHQPGRVPLAPTAAAATPTWANTRRASSSTASSASCSTWTAWPTPSTTGATSPGAASAWPSASPAAAACSCPAR